VNTEPLADGVLIIGTGLLGTSLGMALRRAGVDVWLSDLDEASLVEAAQMGAGEVGAPDRPAALAVVAVPPAATGSVVSTLLTSDAAEFVTDVASVKVLPSREVRTRAESPGRYIGGHPMAGRELSGPAAAMADLFEGRPWVLCPDEQTDPQAMMRALAMVRLVGANPVTMPATDHDAAVALVSHAPHVVAALVAARLAEAPDHEIRLAGQGVTDVTRVAAGDPSLWTEILTANSLAVADVLVRVRGDLDRILEALRGDPAGGIPGPGDADDVRALLADGVAGRGRLPGKHGTPPVDYGTVTVIVDDKPGQLAALFADAGNAGVNIEDVRIDHSPGQPVGMVELDVQVDAEPVLTAQLRQRGWTVHDRHG
jgi:prephenate dehydrogenase